MKKKTSSAKMEEIWSWKDFTHIDGAKKMIWIKSLKPKLKLKIEYETSGQESNHSNKCAME